MEKKYDFECSLSEEYKDNTCCDEWGSATLWLNDKQGVEYNFCIDNGHNSCAIYKMEYDEETNTEIELTINDEIPSDGYSNGRAFGHFAFECENLDEIDKKIKELGYAWEVEPFYMPEVKTRISFLLDPDNNEIELIEKIS